MLTLAPPPPSVADIRPIHGFRDSYLAQGQDGQQLFHNMAFALQRLQLTESLRSRPPKDEVLEYQPVPAQRVRTVRAKFRFVGQGSPMPYKLDESSDE